MQDSKLQKLLDHGCKVDEAVARLMNREDLVLKFIKMALVEKSFDELKDSLAVNDLDTAFRASHSLKGVLSNVGLTTLYEINTNIVEPLRKRENKDYSDLVDELFAEREVLKALIED